MKRMNVLVVGCHPDDVELGCGGTIAKHLERGDKVYALVLTDGERGKHTPGRKECLASLKYLGVQGVFFGEFPDGYIEDNHQTVDFIEGIIRNLKVDRVYTHDPHDRHQDHRNCSKAVSAAARGVAEIFLYQGPSTTVSFEPHYFIQLDKKHVYKKIRALKHYRTQISKGIVNLRAIEQWAGVNGSRCNALYAEAFALNHAFRGDKDV